MPKLTKRTIDAMKPKPAGDVFAWDSELPGFGVRLKPSEQSSALDVPLPEQLLGFRQLLLLISRHRVNLRGCALRNF